MTRAASPLAFVGWAAVALSMVISGCRPASTSGANGSTAGNEPAQPKPEESFQQIVDAFRRAVDTDVRGEPTGFVYQEGGGHSRLWVRNVVTDEFISPTKEGEPYRASITVTSHYTYSLLLPATESGEGKSDGDDPNGGTAGRGGFGDSSLADDGVDVLDQNLIAAATKSDNPPPGTSDEMFARRSAEDVRTYELAYQDHRWVLTSTLDPQTEQSIQYAFEHALASQ